jgi:hypothetical protein
MGWMGLGLIAFIAFLIWKQKVEAEDKAQHDAWAREAGFANNEDLMANAPDYLKTAYCNLCVQGDIKDARMLKSLQEQGIPTPRNYWLVCADEYRNRNRL